ncbi:solute carrier family 12 member 9 isoform X2 [Zootermopsis nevadensis]|uniref:solute carrier family 12 member 9 isoform X2 n=1 Tax=Zootermopsis nevadensis TaxID=136037 RepID=UPI000B8EBD44|nr:solute carrier family 12 member 9 isoform X2 [Zootermopsis nevadensis]
MLAPEIGSTNDGPVSVLSDTGTPVVTTVNEKAPLISKRRFFSSLASAFGFGSNSNLSSVGYVEFGASNVESGRTLGTFAGVFSPVALSMFSALLFLRVGFIVGNAGLWVTLLQFVIAYGILLFTVASVCAVATNGAVEGGGAYFMISRTLGPEFGGSIGTLFFFANIVSSALYITGCTEGIVENFGTSGYLVGEGNIGLPDGRWWRFLYCSFLNVISLVVCLIGAEMFAKTSVVVLGVVCISLLSVIISFCIHGPMMVLIPEANTLIQNGSVPVYRNYTGFQLDTLKANWHQQYSVDYSSDGKVVDFATVFGVLFSGVTGIMAGANMSGELRDPARNIPRGTLSAVAFTFLCYVAVSFLTAATSSPGLLQNDFIFMMPINIWPPFVALGILMATFSASLSNLIGSSRVLEALAKDNVFGFILQFVVKGTWRGNPVAAVLVSWVLVELIMLIGSLNTIAQINSVLFLLSYLATNLACLGLEMASAPNFRPSFKYFTWHTAFVGLIGTLVMMFLINSVYASTAIVLCLVLVIILHLFSPSREAHWGSISQALIFHQVRKYLLLLDSRKDHVKFWRPQMLLLVGNPRSSCPLIQFVNDLKKGGLYVLGHIKVGQLSDIEVDPTLDEYAHWLTLIDCLKVKAFIELTVAHSVREGLQHMIRMSGLGAMKPNTIVLGFFDEELPCDFFEDGSSYSTDVFRNVYTNSGRSVFTLRSSASEKALGAIEYVGMVTDTLKMRRNVCLCRHFHNLDKKLIAKSLSMKFIDVWPVNFFQPDDEDPFDTTSLFMLQLACIINMVPGWKNLHLRVFLCENNRQQDDTGTNDSSSVPFRSNVHRLRQLLQMLRIAATIQEVPGWGQQAAVLQGGSVLEQMSPHPRRHRADSFKNEQLDNAVRVYLLSVNQLLRQHSEQTVASFLYLPVPPHGEEAAVYPTYLQLLTELTADLPPTVLVHGVSAVTSTTL